MLVTGFCFYTFWLNGQIGCSDALQPFIFIALKQIKGHE